MAETLLLKDQLFNETKVSLLAEEIRRVYPAFHAKEFVSGLVSAFPNLELKQRITKITESLKEYLPRDYPEAIMIITQALPQPNNPSLSDGDFGDFIYAPYAEYVARYGCTKEHLNLSLETLKEITKRFSAEDAIRYFINAYPKETMHALASWTNDKHYHVRRLISEGTRPKLPWAQRIRLKPEEALPLLDQLYTDKTRFVTRSVANHINDISKIDSELAIRKLEAWKQSKKQEPEEMNYIIKHALRTLIKQGNKKALAMIGFNTAEDVTLTNFHAPKEVMMNTTLAFSFILNTTKDTPVIIDYIITYQNKKGILNNKKVFKLTKLNLTKNKSVTITKTHTLKEHMTTRTLYEGKHELALQINGNILAKKEFILTKNKSKT